jgi:hypothetical protein
VIVDTSALGTFASASELVIDAATDPATGPAETTIPPSRASP